MNVLVVGSGGREHVLAWKLSQARGVSRLFAAPGNAGTAGIATNLPVKDTDLDGLVAAVQTNGIDLTIVGPEAPLAAGLVDRFHEEGLLVFGPTRAAARIESSKAWAKAFMDRHHIPTAASRTIQSLDDAEAFLSTRCEGPVVVKADGLAAGKGVVMAGSKPEAILSVKRMLDGQFGDAGNQVVLEERLEGVEVSVFAFIDGETVSEEAAACDYKRIGDGDQGPNTGGMGAYSPPEFWTAELARRVRNEILVPTARGLCAEGAPFQGVLYAGLMVTSTGPKVIEFNCRLGDPETAVVLPRLQTDLLKVCRAVAEGTLDRVAVSWSDRHYVSVVLASAGYPGSYDVGKEVRGLETANARALVFHAGTGFDVEGEVVTKGGRVFQVVAGGESTAAAREAAYGAVAAISFDGMIYRRDIAARAADAMEMKGQA